MSRITLLDGSIGQELAHRGRATDSPLWSTAVMARDPEMVGQLHAEYFAAGATVAMTNSYAVLPDRLAGTDLEPRLSALLNVARDQAVGARNRHGSGWVAGALGPLGQTYRGDLVWTVEQVIDAYRPAVSAMAGEVDFFVSEAIASLTQGRAIAEAFSSLTDTPFWLAFTVSDEDGTRLRSGEPVDGIGDVIGRAGAVLLNCAVPEAISAGLPAIAALGRPFGAYGNGFSGITEGFLGDKPVVDALSRRDEMTPEAYAEIAMGWVAAGATIVGGCCEIGPNHIAALHGALIAAGHEVV